MNRTDSVLLESKAQHRFTVGATLRKRFHPEVLVSARLIGGIEDRTHLTQ
jgi:hypothetical protein